MSGTEPETEATLEIATDPPGERWDRFVASAEGATFCHLSGWREVLTGYFRHPGWYLSAVDAGGALRGVLPLTRVRSRLFGDYLVSVPFLNYGGPLGSAAAVELLVREAVAIAEREGVNLLELRTRRPIASDAIRTNTRKITVVLPLPSDPDVLWKQGLEAKVRSQVRRPQKEGMTGRFGTDQLDAFHAVFARNMRDLGTPVLPKGFFEAIAVAFPGVFEICAVYHQGVPVAAGAGFVWGGEFEITWASSLREYNRLAPNMLLYWSFMERMIERGVGVFNFGRCTPGGGTHRFKSQWGGVDEPLPWGQWSRERQEATPNPDGGIFSLATRIWSRLPVRLTTAVGPRLARLLP